MTYLQALLGFAVVAGSMTLLPGLDMMMVVNETINTSRIRGIAAAWGVATGVLAWAVAAAVGLAAIINALPLAYDIIRILGGLYLFYLAFSLLRRKSESRSAQANSVEAHGPKSYSEQPERAGSHEQPSGTASLSECVSSFLRGMVTDVFNPKIGVFYIAIIPQFLVPDINHLQMGISLGLVHFLETMVVLTIIACAASFFAGKLHSSRSQRILSAVSAGIMAILGGVTIAEVIRSRIAA